MKTLLFLPVAYVAGEHGFVFFAPYLAIVLLTVHFARRFGSAARAGEPKPARMTPAPRTVAVRVRA
jgi:hypothetical protein